jgi:hypothetical protein
MPCPYSKRPYDTVVTNSDFQLPEGFGTNPLTLSRVATMYPW